MRSNDVDWILSAKYKSERGGGVKKMDRLKNNNKHIIYACILASQVFSVRIAPHKLMGSYADRKHLASEDAMPVISYFDNVILE